MILVPQTMMLTFVVVMLTFVVVMTFVVMVSMVVVTHRPWPSFVDRVAPYCFE
jgi:hypothetical protein